MSRERVANLTDQFGDQLVVVEPSAGDGLTFQQYSRAGLHGPGVALDRAGVVALWDALDAWLTREVTP